MAGESTKACAPMLDEAELRLLRLSLDNVRLAAVRGLGTDRSREAVIGFVASLLSSVDRVARASVERGVKIACRAGCSYCCSARVDVFAPEIFRIARTLLRRPGDALEAVRARLRAHVDAPGADAGWRQRMPCPFLEDGLCTIYDVRPSACRKAHSLDMEQCRAGADEIPQDLGFALEAEVLVAGTAAAYRQQGFEFAAHELVRSVLRVLDDATAELRWYSGESVFEALETGLRKDVSGQGNPTD